MWKRILSRRGVLLLLGCAVAVAIAIFWILDWQTGIGSPEQITLYSIDGRYAPFLHKKRADGLTDELFHGYPVMGKIEVTDVRQRNAIVSALKWGMIRGDRFGMKKCFWPRHGIRAVRNGKTVDYAICFQCSQLEVYEGTEKVVKPITGHPAAVFNEKLNAAGIPLAPGWLDDDGVD